MYENLLEICKQAVEKSNCNHIKIIGNKAALFELGLDYNYSLLKSEDFDIEINPCMFIEDNSVVYIIPGENKPVKINIKED